MCEASREVYKQIIAIDGPAGAGKSTIAKAIAHKLNYLYIDTGAMYRAVAYAAIAAGISTEASTLGEEKALTKLAGAVVIDMKTQDGRYQVFLNGTDVSVEIRTPEVGAAASPVSAILGVRECLVAQQQRLAETGRVVMDGRDIGTKVLPHADCKIFLTASLPERGRRRFQELEAKGINTSLEQVTNDIAARDDRDSSRVNSPLMQAKDAILLDSSEMTIEEVIEKIEALCKK